MTEYEVTFKVRYDGPWGEVFDWFLSSLRDAPRPEGLDLTSFDMWSPVVKAHVEGGT